MTTEQINALRSIAAVIIDTVREADQLNPAIGAPAGHLYAGLMTAGCTLEQFEQIMGALVSTGKLSKDGDCYHFAGGSK
jgi:hypothetical protein